MNCGMSNPLKVFSMRSICGLVSAMSLRTVLRTTSESCMVVEWTSLRRKSSAVASLAHHRPAKRSLSSRSVAAEVAGAAVRPTAVVADAGGRLPPTATAVVEVDATAARSMEEVSVAAVRASWGSAGH